MGCGSSAPTPAPEPGGNAPIAAKSAAASTPTAVDASPAHSNQSPPSQFPVLPAEDGPAHALPPRYDVFLSHKRSDCADFARALHTELTKDAHGYKVFLDEDVSDDIGDLLSAVRSSRVLIFVLSSHVFESEWCLRELRAALAAGLRVIPITHPGARWAGHDFPPAHLTPPVALEALKAKAMGYQREYHREFVGKLMTRIGPAGGSSAENDARAAAANTAAGAVSAAVAPAPVPVDRQQSTLSTKAAAQLAALQAQLDQAKAAEAKAKADAQAALEREAKVREEAARGANRTRKEPTLSASAPKEDSAAVPSSVSVSAEAQAAGEVAKNAGNVLLVSGDNIGAVAKYTDAIALNPSNAIYYANRAAALVNLRKYHEALKDCMASIALDPKYAKSHYRLGQCLTVLGAPAFAVSAFQKALDLTKDEGMTTTIREQMRTCQISVMPAPPSHSAAALAAHRDAVSKLSLSPPSALDVRDSLGRWREARVMSAQSSQAAYAQGAAPSRIKVHCTGSDTKHDEWLSVQADAARIAACHTWSGDARGAASTAPAWARVGDSVVCFFSGEEEKYFGGWLPGRVIRVANGQVQVEMRPAVIAGKADDGVRDANRVVMRWFHTRSDEIKSMAAVMDEIALTQQQTQTQPVDSQASPSAEQPTAQDTTQATGEGEAAPSATVTDSETDAAAASLAAAEQQTVAEETAPKPPARVPMYTPGQKMSAKWAGRFYAAECVAELVPDERYRIRMLVGNLNGKIHDFDVKDLRSNPNTQY